jgi:hypothetical protein
MFSYRRATDEKKEIDEDLSIQVYSGTSRHQQAEHALIWRHICIFVILLFFAFPISSVLTRRKPAPELSTKSWVVKETQIPLYTSTKNDGEVEMIEEEERAIEKPPTSVPSWFSRSIAKEEDKTAKLSKSKLEINNLWEEKQEAEKMWIEAIEKEEAEQRERRVEYFKLNATLVENQAKQIIKAETLQFFHNVMKFKSERNDGNVNIQSCEQAPDCQQFGWFQHLLPEGKDMCITQLILDKLSAKCNLDPSSVDKLDSETWLERVYPKEEMQEEEVFEDSHSRGSERRTEKSNFICRLMKSKSIQPGTTNPIRSGSDSYGIPYYNKGGANRHNTAVNTRSRNKWSNGDNTAVNKESFTYCDAIAIVGKVVKGRSPWYQT